MNMITYAALLRGIAPMNPNMRNNKLRGVFEELGFANVRTVISSGNVLFETPRTDIPELEAMIEKALLMQLGFQSTIIIRSRDQLQRLVASRPFAGYEHNQKTYLTVTFLQHVPATGQQSFPEQQGYRILGLQDRAIFSVVDLTGKASNLMTRLERQFGKKMTTRTWKTVERIVKALN